MYDVRFRVVFSLKSILLIIVLLISLRSYSQIHFGIESRFPDPSALFGDSLKNDSLPKPKVHSPKKAVIMSACLPGLGQVYNHKYWKVPVIYAGLGGLAYGFAWNQKYVRDFHLALKYRYDNDSTTIDPYPNVSDDDLVTEKNYYRKYRDMCVIGALALYTLNIIDAAVDAHLWNFDEKIDDNLSMNVSPYVVPSYYGSTAGLTVALHFR